MSFMDSKHCIIISSKVDLILLNDLLLREEEKSELVPFYMVEIFTRDRTNSEWCKQRITETTGFVPAIYDRGTHYVTNMRLTLDILKILNDFEFVEEVTGDYTGTLTGVGVPHKCMHYRETNNLAHMKKI
jgi:hypothetical protein